MGPGSVQIDKLELFDRWFDNDETAELSQMFALARYRLKNFRDLTACRYALETYWAHFLHHYFRMETDPETEIQLPDSDNTPDENSSIAQSADDQHKTDEVDPAPPERQSFLDKLRDPMNFLNRR